MRSSLAAMALAVLAPAVASGPTHPGARTEPDSTAPAAVLRVTESGGSLHGRVVNLLGLGIPGAQLQMMHLTGERTDDRDIVDDNDGNYKFSSLVPGLYELSVRRIGFQPAFTQVRIEDGKDLMLNVRLNAVVQQLDTIHAQAEVMPEQYGRSLRMAEFYERRAQGNGHFFTREDIEAAAASSPGDLVQRVNGMKAYTNNGRVSVKSSGCVGTGILTAASNTGRSIAGGDGSSQSNSIDGWGDVALYIDGTQVPVGIRDQEFGALSPVQIEAMEVYRSPTELPPEAVGNACAAVYVWTRIGSG